MTQKMFAVWLDAEGQGALSQGKELYGWNFQVTTPEGYSQNPAKFSVKDAEFADFNVPLGVAIGNAVAALRKQKAEVQAEAGKKATELDAQIQNLLCIEGPSS